MILGSPTCRETVQIGHCFFACLHWWLICNARGQFSPVWELSSNLEQWQAVRGCDMRPQPTILPSTSIMAASKPSRSAEDTWRTWSAAVLKLTLGLLPRAGAGASSASTSSRFSASWDTDVFVVDDSVILQLIVCCCEWPPTFIWGTMEKRERRKRKVKGFHIIQVD